MTTEQTNNRANDRAKLIRQLENAAYLALLSGLNEEDVYEAVEKGMTDARTGSPALYAIRHVA